MMRRKPSIALSVASTVGASRRPRVKVSMPSSTPREASSSVRIGSPGGASATVRRIAEAPMSTTATGRTGSGGGATSAAGLRASVRFFERAMLSGLVECPMNCNHRAGNGRAVDDPVTNALLGTVRATLPTLPMSTPYAPSPDVATPLLRERIRGLFLEVPQGLAGNEESIHQMRVAGRRLRVAIPLLSKKPEGKRVIRALKILRQLTRAAGASRDLDVIVGLLDTELRASGAPSEQAKLLERRLQAARRRGRARMAESLMDLEIAQLRRDLRRVVGRRAEDLFTGLSRLIQQRDQGGSELVNGFASLGETFDAERLHELRKHARRLRYAAEVSVVLRGKPSEAP